MPGATAALRTLRPGAVLAGALRSVLAGRFADVTDFAGLVDFFVLAGLVALAGFGGFMALAGFAGLAARRAETAAIFFAAARFPAVDLPLLLVEVFDRVGRLRRFSLFALRPGPAAVLALRFDVFDFSTMCPRGSGNCPYSLCSPLFCSLEPPRPMASSTVASGELDSGLGAGAGRGAGGRCGLGAGFAAGAGVAVISGAAGMRAAGFRAAFLGAAFLAAGFRAPAFRAGAFFLAAGRLAADLRTVLPAPALFAVLRLAADFVAVFFFRAGAAFFALRPLVDFFAFVAMIVLPIFS